MVANTYKERKAKCRLHTMLPIALNNMLSMLDGRDRWSTVCIRIYEYVKYNIFVLDPSKGVCGDPVGRVAILEAEGPGPPVGVSERQLSPDRGGEKT